MESTAPIYSTELTYTDRRSKAAYIHDKYAPILGGRLLDVGCDERHLAALLAPGVGYVGVDLNAAADVVLDLEHEDLPFEDRAFDTVLCVDVLEHLDRCHAVFDELCRVASERVIVSLPNPLRNLLCSIREGSDGRLKHYGLPTDAPADRHKWFFGQVEAERFLRERGRRAGFAIEQLDQELAGCCDWRLADGTNILEHPNFTGGNTWCVLRRATERR